MTEKKIFIFGDVKGADQKIQLFFYQITKTRNNTKY
jgi:hypothetical protein